MELTKLNQIKEVQVDKTVSAKQHQELINASAHIEDRLLSTTISLIKYLEGHTTKTQVVNQLKTIGTPDALKIIPAINKLNETIKSQKPTDLSSITEVMKSVLNEVKQIPKELPKEKEEKFIDYSLQLKALENTVKTITEAIKQQKFELKPPIVNVEKPDLSSLRIATENVVKAVNSIEIPKPRSPYTENGKQSDVELISKTVPVSQMNILVSEQFDEYRLIYDDFNDDNRNVIGIDYYLKRKKVASIRYSYNKQGRLSGAKKVKV